MPAAPTFQQIKLPEVQKLALDFDTRGYNISDEDFQKRFPNLVKGRQFSIDDALGELNGGVSPVVADALKGAGLESNFGNTSFAQSKNMGKKGQEILSREQRGRDYFQKLLGENPERVFGLGSQDVAHIALANTGGANVFNQGQYGSRVAGYNAALQNQAQTTQGYASALTSLAGIGAKFAQNQQSPYLSVTSYGNPYPYTDANGFNHPVTYANYPTSG
jgi:hypothetical protein